MIRPLLAVLAAALAAPAAAAPIVIDGFEVGDFNITDSTIASPYPAEGEQSGLPPSQVAGGVRLVSVAANGSVNLDTRALLVTNPDPVDDGVQLSVLGGPGDTGTFRFIYDGFANGFNDARDGGLGLDLSGASHFAIQTLGLTGAATAQVTLWSAIRSDGPVTPLVANGTTEIPLSGFTGIDLGQINAVQLTIDGLELLSTPILSSFVAVPEPGSALLLGGGLLALAARRRPR